MRPKEFKEPWHQRNKAKVAEYQKRYQEANKEKIAEVRKRYSDSHKNDAKDASLKFHYGISLDEYNQLFTQQEGKCAICGKHQSECKRALYVDHNHTTGQIRGLLCHHCNLGIGQFDDDIGLLQKAVKYLTAFGQLN